MPRGIKKTATNGHGDGNGNGIASSSSSSALATPLDDSILTDNGADASTSRIAPTLATTTTTTTEGATTGGTLTESIAKQMSAEGIDQFELPRAVITRVAKAELPENVQIRKDAILAVSKSATIFISYLAAVSDELAKQSSRKTISVTDVLEGLKLMEFPEEIISQVKAELKVFRSIESEKKKKAAEGNAAAKAAAAEAEAEDEEEGEDGVEVEEAEAEAAGARILPNTTKPKGKPKGPEKGKGKSKPTTASTAAATDDEDISGAAIIGDPELVTGPDGGVDVDVDEQDEDTEQAMVERGLDDEAEEPMQP